MVEKMAAKLVQQMEEEGLISKSASEHYEYALITLAERFITVGTIVLIGLICKRIVPTVYFLFFFLSLRKRTGGYHADKFWQCYLGTIITYIALAEVTVILSEYPMVMYVLLFLSVVLIEIIGTVNHPNMDMDADELREAKKAARLLTLLEIMIILVFLTLDINRIFVSYMSTAIILCATLLCLAKIIKQEVKVK